MRLAVVSVLLVGACWMALAADEPVAEPLAQSASKYHGDKWVSTDKWEWDDINSKHGSKHGKDGKDGPPGKDGKDGKDGRDGRPGPQGPAGKDGKDGRDGRPGRDGRDAWVVVAWRNGPTNKVNVTSDGCRRAINQITSKVTCAEGEKAIACSCDTGMSSSAGKGFVPPSASSRDASVLTHTNYITLVSNALSGPKDKDKDTCTCTGLYVATIRGSRRGDDDDEGEHEDGDDHHHGHGHDDRPRHHDDHYVDAKGDSKSQPKSADAKGGDSKTDAKIAYKSDEYYDDCKKAPKWQAFEITATATCESVKLVPRPHHKDEYDYLPESEYKYADKKRKSKKYKDDEDDEEDYKKKDEYKKKSEYDEEEEEEKPKKKHLKYPEDDEEDEKDYKY